MDFKQPALMDRLFSPRAREYTRALARYNNSANGPGPRVLDRTRQGIADAARLAQRGTMVAGLPATAYAATYGGSNLASNAAYDTAKHLTQDEGRAQLAATNVRQNFPQLRARLLQDVVGIGSKQAPADRLGSDLVRNGATDVLRGQLHKARQKDVLWPLRRLTPLGFMSDSAMASFAKPLPQNFAQDLARQSVMRNPATAAMLARQLANNQVTGDYAAALLPKEMRQLTPLQLAGEGIGAARRHIAAQNQRSPVTVRRLAQGTPH
jgi:hypothetical protein